MSRRRRRSEGAPARSAPQAAPREAAAGGREPAPGGREAVAGGREAVAGGREPAPRDPSRPGRPPQKLSLAAQIGILVATFAVTVGLAELFGAANLGTSFGIGQITFAIVLVILLVRA